MLDMNPYAAQDRAEAEREAESEAFARWCEDNDIENPTAEDEERWSDEMVAAAEEYAESLAEDRANGGHGYY